MTEWTTRPARHIPEDELHAYLDQALSRSQCVEIETHLSACRACQAQRAAVAAMRDRTTALLSTLAPRPVILPPAYQGLREKHSHRLSVALWRSRFQRAGLWAAGVVAAVGTGWAARTLLDPHPTADAPAALAAQAQAPAAVPAPVVAVEPTTQLEREATPAPIPVRRAPLNERPTPGPAFRAVVPAPTLQLASALIPARFSPAPETPLPERIAGNNPFDRIWRMVPWEDALQIAGSSLPFIEGLTVVGVLLQPGVGGERPMVIVAQQDQNGEVIHSIEGPVAKVNELLRRQSTAEIHASEFARTTPDYVEGPSGPRRAHRVLTVTGRLPVDSLNALVRMAAVR